MTKRSFYITILIISSLLGKRSLAQQPDGMLLPTTFRNAVSQDTGSIANIPWKQFFSNDELTALIDTALENNNDLQVAVRNIEIANRSYRAARLGLLPDVTLSASASILNPSDNSINGLSAELLLQSHHIEDYGLGMGISWEADIWGKVKNQKKETLARYLQTQEARKAVQTTLIAAIANGYYNLLALDLQLQIAKRNFVLSDSTLQILKAQYNAAQVTSLAVQQVEAQALTAAQLIPAIEQEIAIQENALSVLSGANPGSINRSKLLDELLLPGLSSGVPSALLDRRPDVKSAELELLAMNAKVGYTKAFMYPSLTISAQGGVNAFRASDWFNLPASLFGIVAGGITQPLFQKRKLRTQYEVAKIQREQAVIRFRQSVLEAVEEVSNALVKVQKLQEQQNVAIQRVSTLQQATANAGQLFSNGSATYLEVLTAQSSVLTGELQLASLKQLQLSAMVELYRSLGGGW
jgi:NodT family efflux transporter outer membrane factor (OMF) lipoprotein